MTILNLMKVCVGVNDIDQLGLRQAQRLAVSERNEKNIRLTHQTRYKPKRAKEILEGGSIYWVIRREIRVRQLIIDFEDIVVENGKKYCNLILSKKLIPVKPRKHRPFQGWRYLSSQDAPIDIKVEEQDSMNNLPLELSRELRELGLI